MSWWKLERKKETQAELHTKRTRPTVLRIATEDACLP